MRGGGGGQRFTLRVRLNKLHPFTCGYCGKEHSTPVKWRRCEKKCKSATAGSSTATASASSGGDDLRSRSPPTPATAGTSTATASASSGGDDLPGKSFYFLLCYFSFWFLPSLYLKNTGNWPGSNFHPKMTNFSIF